jgi:outer membrane usher protein
VVVLHYPTIIGAGVMFEARMPNGTAVPFGATVAAPRHTKMGRKARRKAAWMAALKADAEAGIVGQNGQIFLRGIAPAGRIQASWGDGADARCAFDYVLPKLQATTPLIRIASTCLPM